MTRQFILRARAEHDIQSVFGRTDRNVPANRRIDTDRFAAEHAGR